MKEPNLELKNFENIKIICLDVDGTLTDGNFYVSSDGCIYKNFYTRDMYAIDRAAKDGFKIVFITGSRDGVIQNKVKDKYPILCLHSCENKFTVLSQYLKENNLTWKEVAYIGDAENDYKCIIESAFSGCPLDAIPEIIKEVNCYSHDTGGRGAVYEIIRYFYTLRKMPWILE